MKLNIKANKANTETKNVVANAATASAPTAPKATPVEAEEAIEEAVVISEEQQASVPAKAPDTLAVPSIVHVVTYQTREKKDAPMIVGFTGPDDPRWKKHKDNKAAGKKDPASACIRRDYTGKPVYILLFGANYNDVAKALAGAYNTCDAKARENAEAAVYAVYEQACRDGKAKMADANKTYTPKEVAGLIVAAASNKKLPKAISDALKELKAA